MSIDTLFDLQQDVRRLFIAGSAMAPGDLRLTKLLPQLRKLGEAAPVFNRLADAVDGLLSASREDSPAKLMELGTLLGAVLYTQGKTDIPGDSHPIEGTDIELATDITYRKLQPVLEALTTKGQGRLEVLRTAYEDRSFLDLRVLPAACAALDDTYAEIPDYLQANMIPAFGQDAVPVLKRQVNLQGGKGDARRLQLLHGLEGQQALGLLLDAANDGAVEPRAAAITMLGAYPEQESFLLDQSREKRKEIRSAALFALASLGTDRALDRLFEAVTSKDGELAVASVRQSASIPLLKRIIAQAAEELRRYAESEGAERSKALLQLQVDLRCLEGFGQRIADAVLPVLLNWLSTDSYLTEETGSLQESVAELLLELDLAEADRFVLELPNKHSGKFIGYSFRVACKLLSPAEVYNRYAGELGGRSAAAKELLHAVKEVALSQLQTLEHGTGKVVPEKSWDPRWLELFVRLDQPELVCAFTHHADRTVIAYLTSKLKGGVRVHDKEAQEMLQTLFRVRHKEAPELLMNVLEGDVRGLYSFYPRLARLISSLPKSYVPRLRLYAEKTTYASVREALMEIVEALEAAPDQTNEESGSGVWGWIKNKLS